MDIRRAAKAVEILNAWPSVLQALVGDTNASLASGIIGYEFACAAEMIRNYSGWATADQTVFKNMMLNKSYPKLAFERQHS